MIVKFGVKMKKSKILLIISVLVCFMLLVCSCGEGDPVDTSSGTNDETTQTYTVKVVNYKGEAPDKDIIVDFMKGEQIVTTKRTNDKGEVSVALEKGEYKIVLSYAKGAPYYDASKAILTPENNSVEIMLYDLPGQDKITISPAYWNDETLEYDRKVYNAVLINEGATLVNIDDKNGSYYVFTPTRGGIYKIGCIASADVKFGYFGDANYVQAESLEHLYKDGYFEIEIKDSGINIGEGGTTRLVFGVTSKKSTDCVITIERTGNPKADPLRIDEMPREVSDTEYKYDYLNYLITDFDITNKELKIVFNENDGFYHLNTQDGPVIFVRVASDNAYSVSFYDICQLTSLHMYEYDEDGAPIKYHNYNPIFEAYAEKCDGAGICPLTSELMNAIKNSGEEKNWWDFENEETPMLSMTIEGVESNVTKETICLENAWAFACCYVDFDAFGSLANPIRLEIGDPNFTIINGKKVTNYIKYNALVGTEATYLKPATLGGYLTIEGAKNITVVYDGVTYVADSEGNITVDGVEFEGENIVVHISDPEKTATITATENESEIRFQFTTSELS